MIKDFINSFFDPNDGDKYIEHLNDFIFPVKCYFCFVSFLLIVIVILNIFLFINIYK